MKKTKPFVPQSKPKISVEAPLAQPTRSSRSARSSRPASHIAGDKSASVDVSRAPQGNESVGQVRKSVIFLGFVIIAYFLYLLVSGQFDEFMGALANVERSWIFIGLGVYVLYFCFGVLAFVLSVIKDPACPVGVRDLMGVEAAGIFFMNLTPNGAGAAPAQIFRLMRSGLSIGQAGALQYTRFVIYEAAEGIFAALILLFRGQYFYEAFGDVTLIGLALFGFKIIQVLFMLAICLKPKMALSLATAVVNLGTKVKLVKHPEKMLRGLNTQVGEFATGFKNAAKNIPEMLLTLLVTLVQLGCLYSLPYFVLQALGRPADLLTCVASGAMLELLTSAIPLPGGTGGAEGGFAFLFAAMFGKDLAAGFVLWRAIEYFIPCLAASTLLGIRSSSHVSIYYRWERTRERMTAFFTRLLTGTSTRPTINYRASQSSSNARVNNGIRVNPKNLKKPQSKDE